MEKDPIVLQLCPPAVPIWAVFYDEEQDEIYSIPVVTLALTKIFDNEEDENESSVYIKPMIFESAWGVTQAFDPPDKCVNFLGFTYKTDEGREVWEREIESCIKRSARENEE